jgi:hypothetical protein
MTILEKVRKAYHEGTFEGMDYAQLRNYGQVHFNSAPGFSKFKKALLEVGLDFDAMKEATRPKLTATHALTLFSDAKAKNDRFGITDKDGNPVWYGKFFDSDLDYNGEQSSGEMAAAKKAVWLASQVAKAVGGTVKLKLMVDAEWLTWANSTDGRGGKAKRLKETADKLCVILSVEHIPGKTNPADYYTVCTGFQSYKEVDLASLVEREERL